MNLTPPDFSTIIIINKNHHKPLLLKIKTIHLKRTKYYAISIIVILVSLLGWSSYLLLKCCQNNQDKQKITLILKQVQVKVATIHQTNSTDAAQNYIQQIQFRLSGVSAYLSKRGIKGFSIRGVGGGESNAKLTQTEQYALYNEYMARLLSTVALTPMGYPRISSITSLFGFRNNPFESGKKEFHPGIDFKGKKGDAVKCTANGKVIYAGWAGGYGNCIRIAHANYFETVYGHLSKINIKVGQLVSVGDIIGEVGSTGRSTAAHLHYEIRRNGKPVNPIHFLTLND
jgi:murein DD-endopeptidase MepM/ murein hydrolase activator NlpD